MAGQNMYTAVLVAVPISRQSFAQLFAAAVCSFVQPGIRIYGYFLAGVFADMDPVRYAFKHREKARYAHA